MFFLEVFKSLKVLGASAFTTAPVHKLAELHRHIMAIAPLAELVLNFFSGFGIVDYHFAPLSVKSR